MANPAVRSSLGRPRRAAWELVLFACAPLVLAVAQFSQLIEQPSKVIAQHLFLVILIRLFLLQPRAIPGSVAYTTGSLLAYSPCCFLLLVLMGAPLTSQVTETAVLAVSMIAFFNLGLLCFDGIMMNGISKLVDFTHTSNKSEATRNLRIRWFATAVLVGAYVGAIPIPLDWDRDWQRWPVTVYFGACTGYAIGLLGICFFA